MNRTTLKLLLPLTVMRFLIFLKMFIIIVKFDKKVFNCLMQTLHNSSIGVPKLCLGLLFLFCHFQFPARPQNFADAAFEKTYCEQFQASSDFQSKNLIAMPGKLAFKKP